jgi:hypothetical protein
MGAFGRAVRSFFARGAEVLLAVGLVIAFFLVCMGILSLSFPRGTSLLDLVRSGRAGEETEAGPNDPGDGGGPAVAHLSHVLRDVKDKPADAIAWALSREGMSLGDYHAVQTFDRSGATISFSESSELALGENTLVILKKADPSARDNRRLASLIVVGGELRGTLAVSRGAPVSVEIEAATHALNIVSDAGPDARAEFAVRVNEDASSVFTIFSGRAAISSEKGTIDMTPNHAVTVDPAGAFGPLREIPPPPVLLEPEDGVRLTFRASRSRMHFGWEASGPEGAGGDEAWLLTVARDSGFRDIVSSELLSKPEHTQGNLREGDYYWRVSARRGDLEGPYSPARRFRITRDLMEPRLLVEFPARVVSAREIVLTGSAEPGTRVFINNEEIPVEASGRFAHAITLQRGVNMVVVEAVDSAGNVAYRTQTIDARDEDETGMRLP